MICQLLSTLLDELLPLLASYESAGVSHWRPGWQALDAHAGKSVILSAGAEQVAGVARGVDERGALLLETNLGVQPVYGGEISLRASE